MTVNIKDNNKIINLVENFNEYIESPYQEPDNFTVTSRFITREFKFRDAGKKNKETYYNKFMNYINSLIIESSNLANDESIPREVRIDSAMEVSKAIALKRLLDAEFKRGNEINVEDRYQYDMINNICFTNCAKVDTISLLELNAFDNKSKDYQVVYDTNLMLAELLAVLSGGDIDIIKDGINENLRVKTGNKYSIYYCNYEVYSRGILGASLPCEIKDISFMLGICPELDQLFSTFREKIINKRGIYVHGSKVLNLTNEEEVPYLLNIYTIMMLHELQNYIINEIIYDVNKHKSKYINCHVTGKRVNYQYAGGFGVISSRGRGILVIQNSRHNNDIQHPEYNDLPEVEYPDYYIKGTNNISFKLSMQEYTGFEWAESFIKNNYKPKKRKHCISAVTGEEYI
jgi:putative component of toxin-antitoxin plasmid stabilization module